MVEWCSTNVLTDLRFYHFVNEYTMPSEAIYIQFA